MLAPSSRVINWIPFILLVSLVVLSLPFCPLFQPFGYDREIFRYAGMLITKGYLPYRDIFDHKPPVIYFIAALAHIFGVWGFWIISLVLTYVTSLVIFKFARRRFTTFSYVLIIPLIYIALCRVETIYEGGGLTREYSQMFATLIIFLRPRNQGLRFFIIGLLYALIFFTQQNEILALTVVIAYFILWDSEQKRLKSISTIVKHGMLFFAGAIAISVTVAGFFYSNHILDEFINQAFLFSKNFYVAQAFYPEFSDTWMTAYYLFPNFVLFAILYVLFAKKTSNFIEYSVFFLAMFIQLCASSMGYHYGHYFLSFIPYFCYCAFLAFTQFDKTLDIKYHRIVACAMFFLFIPPMQVILRFKALYEEKYWSYYAQRSECYEMVKDIRGKDGQLFVLSSPSYLALNTDLNCASLCKLTYFHFYNNPEFDKDNKMFYELVETLKQNRCKYIIDFSPSVPIGRAELQAHWDLFVSSNYHPIFDPGRYRLLQINP